MEYFLILHSFYNSWHWGADIISSKKNCIKCLEYKENTSWGAIEELSEERIESREVDKNVSKVKSEKEIKNRRKGLEDTDILETGYAQKGINKSV